MNTGNKIKEYYDLELHNASDINEHLPTLMTYANQCESVVEMGVRSIVSTWAFLNSTTKKLTSIDVKNPTSFPNHTKTPNSTDLVKSLASEKGMEFEFILSSTLDIEIEETDLLFIDTYHTYGQLSKELEKHSSKAKKFIILHDTEKFGTKGEDGGEGLNKAVRELIERDSNWVFDKVYKNNNGLTVLKRTDETDYNI
jgi:hypothetical protein